jgi:DNA-binding NarL/FixJ family response regulator
VSISVVIADDQGMVRAGLRSLLSGEPDIEVVGEAPDGEHAVHAISRLRPDVALMDIRMPVMDGIEATRRVVADGTATRILMMTTFDLDEHVFTALRAGASGFLLKDASAEELLGAVRALARGDALLSPQVTRRVLDAFADVRAPDPERAAALATLSKRERETLELVARGLTNGEIAAEMVVAPATVKTHVSSVLTKLRLRDRVQAVIFAYEAGLVA